MNEETTKRIGRKTQTPYRVYLFALLGIIVLAGAGYFGWMKYNQAFNSPEAKQQAAAAQAEEQKKEILGKLSKLIVLPEGDPVLFKVSDAEQMKKQQAFFKDVVNEDVLLVFQQSAKAIIFRPSNNVIVNVGPINFDQTTGQVNSSQTAPTTNTKTETTTKK